MSGRSSMPPVLGAVCVALFVAGCSSSGTVGAEGSSNHSVGSLTGGTSHGASDGGSDGSSSGSSDGDDAGCTEALRAIQNAEQAANDTNDVQGAVDTATTSVGQLRDAANTTQKPGGKEAMNKVADDVQAVIDTAQSGQQPSTHQALTDAQAVIELCQS